MYWVRRVTYGLMFRGLMGRVNVLNTYGLGGLMYWVRELMY